MPESDRNGQSVDPEPIEEADETFFEALETLDVEEIMDCWAVEGPVSLLFPGVEDAVGRQMVEAAWEMVALHTSELKTMLEAQVVMRRGELGYSFLSGRILSTHGDEALTVEVYVTNIYKLEEGEWKMVHHHTTPAPHQPSFFEQRLN